MEAHDRASSGADAHGAWRAAPRLSSRPSLPAGTPARKGGKLELGDAAELVVPELQLMHGRSSGVPTCGCAGGMLCEGKPTASGRGCKGADGYPLMLWQGTVLGACRLGRAREFTETRLGTARHALHASHDGGMTFLGAAVPHSPCRDRREPQAPGVLRLAYRFAGRISIATGWGAAASVMIEKFAISTGMPRSEFLDLNYISKLVILVCLLSSKFRSRT